VRLDAGESAERVANGIVEWCAHPLLHVAAQRPTHLLFHFSEHTCCGCGAIGKCVKGHCYCCCADSNVVGLTICLLMKRFINVFISISINLLKRFKPWVFIEVELIALYTCDETSALYVVR
jgi:hypothetical protein